MFTKRKKINENLINTKLEIISRDLLLYNENATLLIRKIYEEISIGKFREISQKIPCIYSNVKPEDLNLPSFYKLDENNYLTLWCDENSKEAKIIYKDMEFKDGIVNNDKIQRFYLDIK